MSRRLTAVDTTTIIDHHLFALVDREYPGEEIPAPHKSGDWVVAGRSSILVESPYDNLDAILRLEEWDGEPEPESWDDGVPWDDIVTVTVECPSGVIGLNQITAGWDDTGFSLSRPGTFNARLACRNGAEHIDDDEEYLVRFWPATPASGRTV
ncbi:hypothetical protein K1W54_37305 [Micromonospora sp. CPCC 205371]|nr:hypothetical protein [Micromonospora sp. CPCC 205371]